MIILKTPPVISTFNTLILKLIYLLIKNFELKLNIIHLYVFIDIR